MASQRFANEGAISVRAFRVSEATVFCRIHVCLFSMPDYSRFSNLGFDDFRRMAGDDSLSRHERIGFPDEYRQGKGEAILGDIATKLSALRATNRSVLDIGPGCGELSRLLIDHCRRQGHRLLLVDSEEVLAQLPNEPWITKYPAYYPECGALFLEHAGRLNAIISYSVLQYVFVESNVWRFLDRSLSLLAEGGEMLIGDIPNVSKRKRFFASAEGVRFHQAFTGTDEIPQPRFNAIEPDQVDDSVVLGLLARARGGGFDAYLLPQGDELPMANRREDILIRRP